MLIDADITPPPSLKVKTVAAEHLAGDKIQPGHPLFGLVWVNPARMHGTPCFYTSRVPLQAPFDTLASGETMEGFLDGFFGVTRQQAAAVLRLAGRELTDLLERS